MKKQKSIKSLFMSQRIIALSLSGLSLSVFFLLRQEFSDKKFHG